MKGTLLSINCNNAKEKEDIRYLLKVQAAEKRITVSKYLLELLKKK